MKKRLFSLLLCAALLAALAGCGAKTALTEPPELTVTNAQGASITAMGGSYSWQYALGRYSGVDACGVHPLDESLRESMPALEMPVTVSSPAAYDVTLDFGAYAPDSVSLRYWSEECRGDTDASSETLAAELQDDGTYAVTLIPSAGIFAADAAWDAEDYSGSATYVFCTRAAGTEALSAGAAHHIAESAQIRKLDISWAGGGVYIQRSEQLSQIAVTEQADAELAESEKMRFLVDGDTLRVLFMDGTFHAGLDAGKYLTVFIPAAMLDAGQLEEVEVAASDAYIHVCADVARKLSLSTVSGEVRVMCASCPEIEIETESGGVSVVDGAWREVSVDTVSGAVELAGSAEELDVETASGDISLTLPEDSGFTLDLESPNGVVDSALIDREGTLVACGDRTTYYAVPPLADGGTCKLEISTVSGRLTIQ